LHPRTPPLSVKEVVDALNKQYMAYDMDHPEKSTSLGVTVSFAGVANDFNGNLFCTPMMGTKCYQGFSDCRMSASLFNWKITSEDYVLAKTFGRGNGYVFNQTLVETKLGKCMYLFDGASENRLNNGCGLGAGADCSKPGSAYANICKSTGKVCTADDIEVKGQLCQPDGPISPPESGSKGNQCFYRMPSLNYPKFDQPNHLHLAVDARVQAELQSDSYKDHNELVIDDRVLIPQIWEDPAVTIPAFFFTQSYAKSGRKAAEAMRDKFSQQYQVGKVPVVGINDQSDFRPNGPFYDPDTVEEPHIAV
jgi:hypothetical protein